MREHLRELGHEVAAGSIHNYFNKMDIKLQIQYIKPTLNSKKKLARLDFILDRRDKVKNSTYHSARNHVHIDESWFYTRSLLTEVMTPPTTKLAATPTTRNKANIEEVMFLFFLTMPQERPDGSFMDGKLGIRSVTTEVIAKRKSKNGEARAILR